MKMETYDSDRPAITPQQYEVLHGGGAEAAEIARQRLSRRRFLRRSMLTIWGVSTAASVAGALYMLYPNLDDLNLASKLGINSENIIDNRLSDKVKIKGNNLNKVGTANSVFNIIS